MDCNDEIRRKLKRESKRRSRARAKGLLPPKRCQRCEGGLTLRSRSPYCRECSRHRRQCYGCGKTIWRPGFCAECEGPLQLALKLLQSGYQPRPPEHLREQLIAAHTERVQAEMARLRAAGIAEDEEGDLASLDVA